MSQPQPLIEAACEVKLCKLDLKEMSLDGTFEGYASLFDLEDLGRDVVVRGAFRASLQARGTGGVKMLFQHDPAQPIGVWERLHEDARGLYARGRLLPEVAKAREVLSLMRARAVDGLSIGFKANRALRDRRSGTRFLHAIDLWEISVVTFPMQPQARVSRVKSVPRNGSPRSEREFEKWLVDEAGFSRSQARGLVQAGLAGRMADVLAGHEVPGGEELRRRIDAAARLLREACRAPTANALPGTTAARRTHSFITSTAGEADSW